MIRNLIMHIYVCVSLSLYIYIYTHTLQTYAYAIKRAQEAGPYRTPAPRQYSMKSYNILYYTMI